MLSREWCEKLKAKGYPQVLPYNDWDGRKVAYQDENHAGVVQATETELIHSLVVAVIPSGDELLAECVKLLRDGEWVSRDCDTFGCTTLIYKEGRKCVLRGRESKDNADLAQAWIWLKERKDAD